MMSELNVENADYILLLSIIHFLDIISYKIFNVDYFVTLFGEPLIIEYSFDLLELSFYRLDYLEYEQNEVSVLDHLSRQ